MKRKTYHRRVFGGKDAQWKGINHGEGTMLPGAIGMSLNVTYDDNLFKTRDGQVREAIETLGEAI